MKRSLNYPVGLFALLFICLALVSKPIGNFQDDISTAVTEQINKNSAADGLDINYFLVRSVAFLTETSKQIADQQQKELTFSFTYEVIETNKLHKKGAMVTGQGKVLFVTDSQDHWHLHHIRVE